MAGRYVDPDPEFVDRVRACTRGLPEVREQDAWAGVRWQVARRTFAHVLRVAERDQTVLTFHAAGEDLHVLSHVGPPFRRLPWGNDALAMTLTPHTNWEEVTEVIRDSYLTRAPKRLWGALGIP